jgi:hypothetical protein
MFFEHLQRRRSRVTYDAALSPPLLRCLIAAATATVLPKILKPHSSEFNSAKYAATQRSAPRK